MKTFVYSALVAAVIAAPGDACGDGAGKCSGPTNCCGTGIRSEDGGESKKMCSEKDQSNPKPAKFTSFTCMKDAEEGAKAVGVSAASIFAASYFLL